MDEEKNYSYIYSAVRTPLGRFGGCFSSLPAPELAAVAVRKAIDTAALHPGDIDEVILGNVLSAGLGQAPARQVSLLSGIPESVGATMVNKVCGSGMKAVMMADQAVRLGQARFVVAGGMENMSRSPHLISDLRKGRKLGNASMLDSMVHDGLYDAQEQAHMGELSQKLADQYRFTREDQDAFAQTSYCRARQATEQGLFSDEIVPVPVNNGRGTTLAEKDEQPFADQLDGFSALNPAFDKQAGTITWANSAKLSDGAAALVIGKCSGKPKPLARIVGYATHAQSPATFALAPVGAINAVLLQNRWSVEDIDLFEINEAFAAMSLVVNDLLKLDAEKVNVHGGSIALGHPIGATGARILVTLVHALRARNLKRGVASLCIGGGEATAMLIEML